MLVFKMQDSIFIEVFGDYPLIRVLDFFLENYIFDYSKTQVAEFSEVSFNTLDTFWDRMEKNGIIKKTRKVGKSQMYQLNRDNLVVKMLLEIDRKLILDSIEDVKVPVKVK